MLQVGDFGRPFLGARGEHVDERRGILRALAELSQRPGQRPRAVFDGGLRRLGQRDGGFRHGGEAVGGVEQLGALAADELHSLHDVARRQLGLRA